MRIAYCVRESITQYAIRNTQYVKEVMPDLDNNRIVSILFINLISVGGKKCHESGNYFY